MTVMQQKSLAGQVNPDRRADGIRACTTRCCADLAAAVGAAGAGEAGCWRGCMMGEKGGMGGPGRVHSGDGEGWGGGYSFSLAAGYPPAAG